jgi:hypothetical protein
MAWTAIAACSRSTPDVAVIDPPSCTLDARAGLALTVVDSMTGQPITSPSLVIAQAATFADTGHSFNGPTYYLLFERAGTYDVTVNHSDYHIWHRTGVVVTADRCHVQRVTMTAALQR